MCRAPRFETDLPPGDLLSLTNDLQEYVARPLRKCVASTSPLPAGWSSSSGRFRLARPHPPTASRQSQCHQPTASSHLPLILCRHFQAAAEGQLGCPALQFEVKSSKESDLRFLPPQFAMPKSEKRLLCSPQFRAYHYPPKRGFTLPLESFQEVFHSRRALCDWRSNNEVDKQPQ